MRKKKVKFDEHMGLTVEEVKAVLKFFNLPDQEYFEWMEGQTCPIIPNGNSVSMGYYWYDLNRWIEHKLNGKTLIWD
jgi:hypothetical protein